MCVSTHILNLKAHHSNLTNKNELEIRVGFCKKYHRGIYCAGCKFKHDCPNCEQKHPLDKCLFRGSNKTGNSNQYAQNKATIN